ncbi:MAG: spore coat protein U domain-containing protein [Proteobacteria bacterium]|nr:spore coat protein U domain-containing protein [Pseudomonadota bacterium]
MDCSVSTSGVGFGDYDPLLATPDDLVGQRRGHLHARDLVDPFSINYTLSPAAARAGSYASRRMNAGTARLNYNLYRDAARAQVWGDGTNSTGTVAGTANFVWFQTSQTGNHTVYGRSLRSRTRCRAPTATRSS